MEFNFETPLILRLRKFAHSKTVLWCGIMFALSVLMIVAENIIVFNDFGRYPDLYDALRIVFCILLTFSFFTVFISARNKDNVLPTGGFTAAGIFSILSALIIVLSNLIFQSFYWTRYLFVYISISDMVYPAGLPAKLSESDNLNVQITGAVLLSLMILFCLILAATFFSSASVAKNNKPRRFFPILLTVLSFTIAAFYIVRFVYFLIAGDFYELTVKFINAYSHLSLEYILSYVVCFISEFIIAPITLILCGCMGIGFAKVSRRIK